MPLLPNKIFYYNILKFLAITAVLSSCHNTSEQSNRNFLKKYSKEVKLINDNREVLRQQHNKQDCKLLPNGCIEDNKKWQDTATIFGIKNIKQYESAFIDTSQIKMPEPPEEFLPNEKTLLQNNMKSLPQNMFHISYNLHNFPKRYGRPKLSFDDIKIPSKDMFGEKTELGEKNYQLIGNQILQKDIDFSKQLYSEEDKEIMIELIKQEKRIGRDLITLPLSN